MANAVQDKSWSPILFEVRRSNIKVGVSLHSSECQSSSFITVTFRVIIISNATYSIVVINITVIAIVHDDIL